MAPANSSLGELLQSFSPRSSAERRDVVRVKEVLDEPSDPSAALPETEGARLRWLPVADAIDEVEEDNLEECLRRAACMLDDQ